MSSQVTRYLLFVGSITTVEAAYLEVFVNARDVMCSDSRLFRCEMDFILKNKTEATDIKDDATCIKGRIKKKQTNKENTLSSSRPIQRINKNGIS